MSGGFEIERTDAGHLFQEQIDAILRENDQPSAPALRGGCDTLDSDGSVITLFVGEAIERLSEKVAREIQIIAGMNDDICYSAVNFNAVSESIDQTIQTALSLCGAALKQNLNTIIVVDTADERYRPHILNSVIDSVVSACNARTIRNRWSVVTLIDLQRTNHKAAQEHLDLVETYQGGDTDIEFHFILESCDEEARPITERRLAALVAYVIMLLNSSKLLNPTQLKQSVRQTTERNCSIAHEVIDTPLEKTCKQAAVDCFIEMTDALHENALAASVEISNELEPGRIIEWVERPKVMATALHAAEEISLGAFGTLRAAEKKLFGTKLSRSFERGVAETEAQWNQKKTEYLREFRKSIMGLFDEPEQGLLYIAGVLGKDKFVAGSIQGELSKYIDTLQQSASNHEHSITYAYDKPEAYDSLRLVTGVETSRKRGFFSKFFGGQIERPRALLERELQNRIYNHKLDCVVLHRKIDLLNEISQIIKDVCKPYQDGLEKMQEIKHALTQTAASDTDPYFSVLAGPLQQILQGLTVPYGTQGIVKLFKQGKLGCLLRADFDEDSLIKQFMQTFSETVWPTIRERFGTLESMIASLAEHGYDRDTILDALYGVAEKNIVYPYRVVNKAMNETVGAELRFLFGSVGTKVPASDYVHLDIPLGGRLELIKIRIGINPDSLVTALDSVPWQGTDESHRRQWGKG
jgi:hypothetical protein